MAASNKPLLPFVLLAFWLLSGCGFFAPAPLSEPEILATADAIRARTPNAIPDREDSIATATQEAIYAILATDETSLTEEAENDRWNDATMEVVDATANAELATYEAGRTDCPGGCIDYPTWCETVIKGNVSIVPGKEGERIYHLPSDEFYEKTKINPAKGEYYFCTPEEAEAAGFRRAYQ
jgi:hypothetical protein